MDDLSAWLLVIVCVQMFVCLGLWYIGGKARIDACYWRKMHGIQADYAKELEGIIAKLNRGHDA